MQLPNLFNQVLARRMVAGFEDRSSHRGRINHGRAAAWVTLVASVVLFLARALMGWWAGSVAVTVNAFHLLSHAAAALILLYSYWLAAKPATKETPFGHGRMEYVAPLVMAVILAVAGLRLGDESLHQILEPHQVHVWGGLPWLLLGTVALKLWAGQFVTYLARRVGSGAINAMARHERIEAIMSLAVVAGLLAEGHWHLPWLDGAIGLGLSLWLIYAGVSHALHSLTPLLGGRPDPEVIARIRGIAGEVEGVDDVHEIIVHDYGTKYLITLHVEVSPKLGPEKIHHIVERAENRISKVFGGEVVGHADPLVEKGEKTREMEERLGELLEGIGWVEGFHRFRLVAFSPEKFIMVADVNLSEDVPEEQYQAKKEELERLAKEAFPGMAYATFSITPKFTY